MSQQITNRFLPLDFSSASSVSAYIYVPFRVKRISCIFFATVPNVSDLQSVIKSDLIPDSNFILTACSQPTAIDSSKHTITEYVFDEPAMIQGHYRFELLDFTLTPATTDVSGMILEFRSE